jgi:hypothetical protein
MSSKEESGPLGTAVLLIVITAFRKQTYKNTMLLFATLPAVC